MRIGIDATAVPPKPMGAGLYIIYLVREIANLESDFEFVVFAQDYLRPFFADIDNPRVKIRWVGNMHPGIRLVWEQIRFPVLIRGEELDLLHSPHYTMPLSKPVKEIVTFHDLIFLIYPELHTRAKRVFFPWMMRRSARKADLIITDSDSTKRDAAKLLGVDLKKMVTVPLGYQEIFKPIHDKHVLQSIKKQYKVPDKFILYVGAIEPRKNVPLLLRVYKRIVEQGYPHHLVIPGKMGWMVKQVIPLIKELGIEESVNLMGYVPYVDLPAIYNLADLFVYPSVYEGFGLPPLEAMACGTPVITSNISSMPEVVGDAAILVPPNDEDALYESIIHLLADSDYRKELRTKGLKRATQFTWKHTAQKTLALYQEVLSRK